MVLEADGLLWAEIGDGVGSVGAAVVFDFLGRCCRESVVCSPVPLG